MNTLKPLPTGIQTFSEIIEGGYLYVDKTALVHQLTCTCKYVFMSRPRRFGKSVLCSTLKSYFEGRSDLFRGLAMEQLETEWRHHPVLLISLATMKGGTRQEFYDKIDVQLSRYERQFGLSKPSSDPGARLQYLIEQTPALTGERAVVIIDEYDAPLLTVLHEPERLVEMRQTVRSFLGCLKDCDPYLRFVFITGITKFSQVSIFSELNNLDKITMMPQYSTICGITQEELQTQMMPHVEQLAADNGLTVEETLARLKRNYDGYHFARDLKDVYNPYSLWQAFKWGEIKDFWFDTGTPSSLLNMLEKFGARVVDFDDGCLCEAHEFDAPTEKMTTAMPFFYQSGYLTIKDYDPDFRTYRLGFPNKEVEHGFVEFLAKYYIPQERGYNSAFIADFVRDVRKGEAEKFMQRLDALFASGDYQVAGDAELYFQNAVWVIFKMIGFYTEVERHTTDGRMDMLIQTQDFIYIIEFKLDKSADEALQQIKDKQYAKPFEHDTRTLYEIGVNFSSRTRRIEGWKIQKLERLSV